MNSLVVALGQVGLMRLTDLHDLTDSETVSVVRSTPSQGQYGFMGTLTGGFLTKMSGMPSGMRHNQPAFEELAYQTAAEPYH